MIDFLDVLRPTSRTRLALAVAGLLAITGGLASQPTVIAQSADQSGVRVAAPVAVTASTDEIMRRHTPLAALVTIGPRRASRRLQVPRPSAPTAAADLLPLTQSSDAELTLGVAFTATTLVETSALPPDTMGAAGPTQFILASNGRIRSFTKSSGVADGVLNTTTDVFFASVRGTAGTFGPRIRYDRLAGRWFITIATDDVPGRVLIASSNQGTISSTTTWSFFSFSSTFPGTACIVDSPTLGLDNAALYIGVNVFCGTAADYAGTSAFVVRKASAVDAGSLVVTQFPALTTTFGGAGPFAPQGVDNDDPASNAGYLIGVDNASFGTLMLRRVNDPGGLAPTLSPNIAVAVAPTALPIRVPHLGNLGGVAGQLDAGDDRIASAKMTGGRLWAAHTVGVTEAGVASGTPTRNGVRWYELGSLATTPALVQSGTLNSSTPGTGDRHYWVPSIAVSGQGRAVIGASAAGVSEFANAAAAERYASDGPGTLRTPALLTASVAAYNPPNDPGSDRGRRWGGYSETSVDPCDNQTVWTVQQFADAADSYGLHVARTLSAPPATPVSVSPTSLAPAQPSVDVTLTASSTNGSAFFDPGAGFACRPTVTIPGVVVNSVTVTGPTTLTVNLSTVNAPFGSKAITVTNPDGQSVTGASMLTILAGPAMWIESPVAGPAGQPLVIRGWAIDGAATSGSGVAAVHIYATPAGGAPVFLGAATYGGVRTDIAAQYGSRFLASGFTLTATETLPQGSVTIVAHAQASVTGAFNNSVSVVVSLGNPAPPFGAVDTPADNATVAGEVGVTGWALDDGGVARIEVSRDNVAGEPTGRVFLGNATFVSGARPDVRAAYPQVQNNDTAGWGFMVLTNMLPNRGNGSFTLHAHAFDYGGLSTLLGSKRITGANTASTLPFGTIDTPAQGATVSGTIINFGWALTPSAARRIPFDGSTIDVYIDGVWFGHPVYNQFRSDIAALFPGLQNTNGAVGYFTLDTTRLSNGLHTIAWVIRDDGGGASGVGSRYFRVQNGS